MVLNPDKPTLEAVKAIAKRIYQQHTLGNAHREHSEHFQKWLTERYNEFSEELAALYEPTDRIYVETDNGNKAVDIVVKFFDLEDFTFEINLKWSV